MTFLNVVPGWAWWLLALLAVGGVQQLRVADVVGDLQEAQNVQQDIGERLAACRETRGNLLVQTGEQNRALSELRQAGLTREANAEVAQASAHVEANKEYQAANRLQQERSGGEVCAASEGVIDRELGL